MRQPCPSVSELKALEYQRSWPLVVVVVSGAVVGTRDVGRSLTPQVERIYAACLPARFREPCAATNN